MQVFDPQQDVQVVIRSLPHWSQTGTISFITWRTGDSIPLSVYHRWLAERRRFLQRLHVDPDADDWKQQFERIEPLLRNGFRRIMTNRWNRQLDTCYGECVLGRSELSKIVADSLLHFDGERYELTDFVVMPNHVHLLAAFPNEESMLLQCESWKRFTATKINRLLQRKGRFWQADGFDHLVRTTEQFEYLRAYIADNPRRARLSAGQYVHYSKHL